MNPLPRSFSIRRHLTLLVLAVMLPLILLNTFFIYRQVQREAREAHEDVQRLAHLAAADASKLVEAASAAVTGIAHQRPRRFGSETPACDALFADIGAADRNFTRESLVREPDGRVLCSSEPSQMRFAYYAGPRTWLASIASASAVTMSPAYLDAKTRHWMVDFGYPLPHGDGRPSVLMWSVDLATTPALHYRTHLASELLPQGSCDTLIDGTGRVLARWPYDQWIGRRAPDAGIIRAVLHTAGEGTMIARGLDGDERLYGYAAVPGTDWKVYIGIPTAAALLPNQIYMWQSLLLGLAVTLLVAGLAAYVGRRIAHPIEQLTHAAGAASGGRLETRVTPRGLAEVRDMAERFNTLLSARQHAESALAEEKRRAEITLHSIGDAVIRVDRRCRVTYLNPAAEQLTGWPLSQALGRPLTEVVVLIRGQAATLEAGVARALDQAITSDVVHDALLLTRNGGQHDVSDSIAPLVDPERGVVGAVLAFHDITETRELERRLSWQARHDPLTGLINRVELERQLVEAIDDARAHNTYHVLLYVDLDQFKVVNDTKGHAAGDELLRRLADLFKGLVATEHTIARVGGDEFCMLLRNVTIAQAQPLAEHIRAAVQDFRFAWDGSTFAVGASIGLVAVDAYAGALEEIMNAADVACYAAKERGRNRVHVFVPEDEAVRERLEEPAWVRRIGLALAEERFRLYQQAIVPTRAESHDPVWHEILVRLCDERRELLPPTSFLPAAQRYNILTALDRWVVSHAFERIARSARRPCCTINLSGHAISDDRFLDFVIDRFDSTGVEPGRICFEITESAAVVNLPRATHFMRELRKRGARFALDDFGIGISSLAYLRTLPVDIIKIDGRFVRNIDRDHIDHAMVEAIIRIGRVMHLKTVAEFVENERTRTYVQALGVDYAQGFGVSKPQPIESILDEPDTRERQGA